MRRFMELERELFTQLSHFFSIHTLLEENSLHFLWYFYYWTLIEDNIDEEIRLRTIFKTRSLYFRAYNYQNSQDTKMVEQVMSIVVKNSYYFPIRCIYF